MPPFLLDGQALCAETDPDLFFPAKGGDATTPKSICRRCDLVDACLEYALAEPVDGVWGGTSPRQRASLARAQGRAYGIVRTVDVGLSVTDDALQQRARRARQAAA